MPAPGAVVGQLPVYRTRKVTVASDELADTAGAAQIGDRSKATKID
ncbi:MAG: hypothetical protein M3003_07295 [Candidatus Dormibacteraeota bacterium]|nr:hypothetical protein [Candidatus Dormibacteraeota bacterium]